MKRFVWLAFLALILTFSGRAQAPTFQVEGYVFSIGAPNPVPVPNQAVYISIDSTNTGFTYSNTVYTNGNGYFIDYIYLPPENGMAMIQAATYDQCLGYNQVQMTFWAPGTQPPPFEFRLCDNTLECQAMFEYWADPVNLLSVQFMNTSFGPFTACTWDFGDGTISSEFSPVHVYPEGGEYMVTLTISDDSAMCSSTVINPVFVGQSGLGCENAFYYVFSDSLTADFTGFLFDSLYTNVSYEWDFGDGTAGSGQSIAHTFSLNPNGMNVYMVCLTTVATDNTGESCTSVSCQEVYVGFPPPSPCESYFYPINQNNLAIDFEAYTFSQYPTDFAWDFGDNTTGTGQYVSHTYPQEGIYLVSLHSVDANGCEFDYSMEVWVGNWPSGCDNWFYYEQSDSLTFTFTGEHFWFDSTQVAQTTYFWDFGDGTTGTGQTITHTFSGNPANGGDVFLVCLSTVSMSVTGDSCFATSCQEVWVNGNPGGDCFNWFDYIQNDFSFDFTGYVSSFIPADYLWEFGDGTTATGQQVSHTYAQSGIYYVVLTTTDSTGCTFCSVTELWVNSFPSFAIFGYVHLADSLFADDATVRLMTTDSTWQNVIEVAAVNTSANGFFQFDSVPMYNYRLYFLQAELNEGSTWYGEYLPTYHLSALNWQEATPVMPLNNWPFDIYMIPGTTTSAGPGAITGNVSSMSRSTLENIEVILMDEEMQPYLYARSDGNGEFAFEGLAYGNYMLYAEIMGIQTTPVMITLSEAQPEASVEVQVQGNEASYVVFGITEKLVLVSSAGQPYPNPTGTNASLEFTTREALTLDLNLYNQMGQLTWKSSVDLGAGTSRVPVSLEGLPSGLYFLKAVTAQGDYITRRIIRK